MIPDAALFREKFYISRRLCLYFGNMIIIRPSNLQHIDAIMAIYDKAKEFMRRHGNPTQWREGYPPRDLIVAEISQGRHFSCFYGHDIVGVFSFIMGEDSTYGYIEDGAWLNDAPYGTIHRLASSGVVPGIAGACIEWCAKRCGNLRADTHRDNLVMQHILLRHAFVRCGIIYVQNGSKRIAYQRTGIEQERR